MERGAHVARALVLLAALLFVATRGGQYGGGFALDATTMVAALYVLATSVSSSFWGEVRRLSLMVTAVDIVLITSLVYGTGGLHSGLYPLYYLPMLHAAVRLSLRDAVGAALLSIGTYFLLGYTQGLETRVSVRSATQMAAFASSAAFMTLFFSLLMRETRQHQIAKLQAERLLGKVEAVVEVAAALSSTLNLDQILDLIVRRAPEAAHAEAASIILPDPQTGALEFRAASGPHEAALSGKQMPPGSGIAGWVLERSEAVLLAEPQNDPRFNQEISDELDYAIHSLIAVPIPGTERVIGCLEVLNKTAGGSFDEEDQEILATLAVHAGLAIENARLYEATKTEAITDALTGLYNRGEFERRIVQEVDRAKRHGRPMSIIMADIDNFKRVNDAHGHAAGDHVLREVAALLQRILRSSDIIARYGGEEFVTIHPEAEEQGGVESAERIRQAVGRHKMSWPGISEPISITISCGVAALNHESDSAADLLARADEQLYRAKADGRNEVRAENVNVETLA